VKYPSSDSRGVYSYVLPMLLRRICCQDIDGRVWQINLGRLALLAGVPFRLPPEQILLAKKSAYQITGRPTGNNAEHGICASLPGDWPFYC
jgi:hypothetical protein